MSVLAQSTGSAVLTFKIGSAEITCDNASASPSLAARVFQGLLPEAFPASVTPDYLHYQLWDTVQGLCSYVRGMLANAAILQGVGVGSVQASALSAVTSFFVRDMTSMVAGLVFTYHQGSNFDAYAKQWRLAADCLNNVGMALELVSPIFPRAFLLLATAGAVARAVTGAAGGATRHALTQHFCKGGVGSPGDISAKEGSQESVATLLGMLLGMLVLWLSSARPWAAPLTFGALTALHIFSNVRALRTLQMTSVNPYRLLLLVDAYVRSMHAAPATSPREPDDSWQHVVPEHSGGDLAPSDALSGARPRPAAVAEARPASAARFGDAAALSPSAIGRREPLLVPELLRWWPGPLFSVDVVLGADLRAFCLGSGALVRANLNQADGTASQGSADAWKSLVASLQKSGFAVLCHVRRSGGESRIVRLAVLADVTAGDAAVTEGCFAAAFWAIAKSQGLVIRGSAAPGDCAANFETLIQTAACSAAARNMRDIGVLLPGLSDVLFRSDNGSPAWNQFRTHDVITELHNLGWNCTSARLKCHHTFKIVQSAGTGDKKDL